MSELTAESTKEWFLNRLHDVAGRSIGEPGFWVEVEDRKVRLVNSKRISGEGYRGYQTRMRVGESPEDAAIRLAQHWATHGSVPRQELEPFEFVE